MEALPVGASIDGACAGQFLALTLKKGKMENKR